MIPFLDSHFKPRLMIDLYFFNPHSPNLGMGWCATLAMCERGTQCLSDFDQFPRRDEKRKKRKEIDKKRK